VVTGLLVVALLVMTAGYVVPPGLAPATATSPVSDSMEPTISQHDLLVVTVSEPSVGDVVLYESPNHERPVLHRVVDVTEAGYVTRGDANEATDQANGEPHVTEDRIHGTAPTVGGSVVTIPLLGAIVTNPAVLTSLWLLSAVGTVVSARRSSPRPKMVSASPGRTAVFVLAAVIVIAVPIAAMGSTVAVDASIVSTETAPADSDRLVAVGETTERTITLSSPTMAGTTQTAHVDGDLELVGIESTGTSTTTDVVVRNPPASEPGAHTAEITLYTYPATLPQPVIAALASVHPALAGAATGAVIAVVFGLLALVVIDPRQTVRRGRGTIRAVRKRREEVRYR
jgi:signal peptidase